MFIVLTKSGTKVFLETYQFDADRNVIGTRKSKDGKIGKVVVPNNSVDTIEEWERNDDE